MGFFKRLIGLERRSSASPCDPVLAEWFGSLSSTASGVHVSPESAMRCPAVAACVGLLADTIGTIPLDLFERAKEGVQERATSHPLHALLHDAPNSYQTSAEFRQMQMVHLCTYNNAYARIRYRGDGLPDALEPIHPAEIRPFKRQSGGHAYQYTPSSGSSEILLPDEVLHLKHRPFCRDGLMGESAITRHRETIGLALAASEYLARFFSNNAMSRKGVKLKEDLSPENAKRARQSWDEKYLGLHNAHKLIFFPPGIEPVDLGMSNADAQMVELYKNQVAEIARIWGVPLHMIGETDKSTSWGSGIEQQSIGFIVYFIRPWLVTWEQALNRALLPPSMRGRYFFEFNADGLLRGDFKTRTEGYAMMIQWGLATPNEIRRLMNFAPLEGGDSRLQPLNMAPAERIMDVLLRDNTKATRALAELQGLPHE